MWSVIWFSSELSTSCATGIEALTSMIGSPPCTIVPSGMAQTSPSNRSGARSASARSSNPIEPR